MIKQMGFAMAAGILIDAFVVRLTLVPAVIAVLGEKAWWLPQWLDRLLPNLDVEGDKLMAELKKNHIRPKEDDGKDRVSAPDSVKGVEKLTERYADTSE